MCCVEHHIDLLAVWVPREENERADYLSKTTEHYDFSLGHLSFQRCDKRWGPHTIDRFSSENSVRVSSGRYNARFLQHGEAKGCEGIDAFRYDWKGENNWCHPPYKMVGQAVAHMRKCKASGTILVPMWKRAAWWPSVRSKDGEAWAPDVIETMRIGNSVGFNGGQGALAAPESGCSEDLPKADLWEIRVSCS